MAISLLAYFVLINRVFGSYQWIALAYSISFLTTRHLNRTAWNWAHNAVLSSEAFASYLYKTGNLHIRYTGDKEKTALVKNASEKTNSQVEEEFNVGILNCNNCEAKLYVDSRRFDKNAVILKCPKCEEIVHGSLVQSIQDVKMRSKDLKDY